MANFDITVPNGTTRVVPDAATADGAPRGVRLGKYGEVITSTAHGDKLSTLGHEGSYYVATNATLGTAIVGKTAPTAFSATAALLSIYNGAATGGKAVSLDYIRLYVRVAGASSTQWSYALSVDRGNRFSSGGTAITPINANINSDLTSAAVINFGDVTATAASASVRRLSHGQIRSVIKVVGDVYEWRFGDSATSATGMPLEGTLQAHIVTRCAPCVLWPNTSFLFHEIAASQGTAAQYEFEIGYWER